MPIFRQPKNTVPSGNPAFQSSVSSVPMAMSMMIDSMVHMVQNSRPETGGQGLGISDGQE